jgi:hypothetical protein
LVPPPATTAAAAAAAAPAAAEHDGQALGGKEEEEDGFSTPPPQPMRSDWILDVYAGREGAFPCFRATCSHSNRSFVGDSPDAVYRQIIAFAPLSVRSVAAAAAAEAVGKGGGHGGGGGGAPSGSSSRSNGLQNGTKKKKNTSMGAAVHGRSDASDNHHTDSKTGGGGSSSGGGGGGGQDQEEEEESVYTPWVLDRTASSAELFATQPSFLQDISGGNDFFGFTKLSVRTVIERLADAAGCRGYAFRTIPRSEASMPTFNHSGCARTEQHKWENRASAEVLLQPRRRLTKNVSLPGDGGAPTIGAAAAAAAAGMGPASSSTKSSKRRRGAEQPAETSAELAGKAAAAAAAAAAQRREEARDADGDLSLVTEDERTADILLEGLAPAQASAQYRLMKKYVHSRVVVRSSVIHAWGLFAKTPFKAHEMVIEYTGMILRMQVADRCVCAYRVGGRACVPASHWRACVPTPMPVCIICAALPCCVC